MTSGRNRKGGDELSAGQVVLGRYRVERLLDEGGMASIYLAMDLRTNQPVAVKCLYKIYTGNDVVRARFIDEGRIQMMLQHPNIVRVYQFMEQPTLAFVMEFVQGQTLEELLLERGVMEMSEILEIMIPVLSALGLAHSRHIVHRDLKPSNILLNKSRGSWHPKVMDFGVAKLKRTKNLTATGTTVGTLHYMSPEQIVGSKKIDGRADIYSLGITLYKLCTGDVPFNAATEFALMMAQVETPPTPPRALNPRISPEFEEVILKALEKKSARRFQNIKEFTSALLELRDARGHRTRDTIDVPESLIEFAMRADRVAVDRTDEIMLSSRELGIDPEEQARTLERERPEEVRQLAASLASSLYAPIGEDEGVDTTVRMSQRSGEHVLQQLHQGGEEDGGATIELESLKLDDSLLAAARRAQAPGVADDELQTMDMALDITTRSRLATDTLAQLMRESEQRKATSTGPSPQGEEDRTAPMRVKTDEIAGLARRNTSPPPSKATTHSSQANRTGSPSKAPPSNSRHNPFARPTNPENEPNAGRGARPVQMSTSSPVDHRSSPFNRPPPSSPLPAEPDYAPYVVGKEGVDTSERTVPFKMKREDAPSYQQGAYREPFESSHPATITAERYPDQHPAWEASTQGQQHDKLAPYTPPSMVQKQSFFESHGRTVLIGLLVFFSAVCLLLIVLLILR